MSALQEEYDAAVKEFHLAQGRLIQALEAMVREITLEAWPKGVELEVHGEYNEEGLLRLSAKRVKDAAGEIIAGLDEAGEHIDDDEDAAHFTAWDYFTDLVESNYLTWLGELTGEDYLHDQTIFLVEPHRLDPTDLMDDDEIAAHNEAMEHDPQYRDAIHMERN